NPVRPRDVLPTPLSEFRVKPSDVLHNLSGHIQHAPTGSVVGHVVFVLIQNIQLILRRTLRPRESPHEVWFGGVDTRRPPPIMGWPDVVIQQAPMVLLGFPQRLYRLVLRPSDPPILSEPVIGAVYLPIASVIPGSRRCLCGAHTADV